MLDALGRPTIIAHRSMTFVQRIIRRHGGAVRAEGEVDRGATFCFAFGQGGCGITA